jgi:ABC-type transporter Mla subunit MlaD
MKREYLEGLGLEKDVIDKIMGEHGKTVEGNKQKLSDATTSLDDVKAQLSQRDKDLKELKKQAEGSTELQTKFTDLETKYNQDKLDFETKIKDTQLSSALKIALAGKVHDADLVATLIDKNTIELGADGNVTKGLDEQIKTLQESKSFLFVPETTPAKIAGTKPAGGSATGDDPAASIGANFAKSANEQSKPVATTLWG